MCQWPNVTSKVIRNRSVSLTSSVINVRPAVVLANVMPAANVQQVHLVRQEVLVWMVHQAAQASQANQAKITLQARIAELAVQTQLHNHQVKAHLVHLVRLVPPVLKELQALLVDLAKEAELAPLVQEVHLVQLEEMANQAPKVQMETMLPEAKARKDPKDHLVQLVNPDPRDPMETQPLAAAELVHLAQLDHLALEVQLQAPANKALKVHPAIPAQMPNIVLAHQEADWSIVVALSLFSATSIKKLTSRMEEKKIKFLFLSSFALMCVVADLMAPHFYDSFRL